MSFKEGDRIAVDPTWSNLGLSPHYATVQAVKGFLGRTLVVLYDGATSTSEIEDRLARHLKDGES